MFVTLNNEKIFYNKLGNETSEKTILWIHGSAMSGKPMEDVASLMPDYNHVTIDLPGHVNSSGEPKETVELNADFITAFIRELKHSKQITEDLTVAGYSLGGCITLELALRKVPEVKRIAVLNSCDFANAHVATIVAQDFEEFDFTVIGKIAYGSNSNAKVTTAYFAKHKANDFASFVDVIAAVQYPMKDFDTIEIPTIFITGDEDRVAPIANVMNLRKLVPNSALSVIPHYGHMAILEVPEIYAQNINDFIRNN